MDDVLEARRRRADQRIDSPWSEQVARAAEGVAALLCIAAFCLSFA